MTVREALQALGQPGVHPPDARHRAPPDVRRRVRSAQRCCEDPADPGRREMLARFADQRGLGLSDALLPQVRGQVGRRGRGAAAAGRAPIGAAPGERAVHARARGQRRRGSTSCSAQRARPRRRLAARAARAARAPTRACRWPIAAMWRACIRSSSGWSATCGAIPARRWPRCWTPARSERQEAYAWLFKTRHKSAQDRRIRELLERDAFAQIHRSWQRLGYPVRIADAVVRERDRRLGRPAGGAGRADGHHRQRRRAAAAAARRRAALRARHALRDPARAARRGAAALLAPRGGRSRAPRAASSVVNDGTARRLKGALLDANGSADRDRRQDRHRRPPLRGHRPRRHA